MSRGIVLPAVPTPTPPASGYVRIFIDSDDGLWKVQDSAGVVTGVGGVGPTGPAGADGAQFGDPVTRNAQTGTTYTFVLGDEAKLNTFDNADAVAVTIPTDAAQAIPVNTMLACGQLGAGLVTMTGDTGVTVNGVSAGSVASSGQYASWTLTKIAADTWWASGGAS